MFIKHLCSLAACSLVAVPALSTGTFTGLAQGGKVYSISSDGSTMVGESSSAAAKWDTATFGYTNLGVLAGDVSSMAYDVSADGSVVVGRSGVLVWDKPPGSTNTGGQTTVGQFDDAQGVVWSGGSATALQGLSGSFGFTGAYGISADGTTVVGVGDQNYNPYDAIASENGRAIDLAYDPNEWNFNPDGTAKVTPDYDPTTRLNDQWRTGLLWDISGGAGSATPMDIGLNTDFGHDPAFAPGTPLTGSGTPGDPWADYNRLPTYSPTHPSYPDWMYFLPIMSVSADGSRAIGWGHGSVGTWSVQYDDGAGTTAITAAQFGRSWARRISDNGLYSVGGTWANGGAGQDTERAAFRYTQTAGWQVLPFVTPFTPGSNSYTEMYGVSENGWFAVGAGDIEVFVPPFFTADRATAAIWDEINGTQTLADFLAANGVTGYESWFLKRATDVHYDQGTNTLTIVGYGSATGDSADNAAMTGFHIVVDNVLSRGDYNPGDATLDGTTDFSDFLVLQTGFGTKGFWLDGDFNGDGLIDFSDFLILQTAFGTSTSGPVAVTAEQIQALEAFAAANVPEPTSLALLGLGGLTLIARRRRA